MALKKLIFSMLALVIAGLTGLFLAIADFNHEYELQDKLINDLTGRLISQKNALLSLNREVRDNRERIQRLNFLEYKANIFSKKFPAFSDIVDAVYLKSQDYGFHPNLILGIVQVESAFNPLAVSSAGAYGLMQVHYSVWKDELRIDKKRIFDIDYNIDLGLQILKQYYEYSNRNIGQALFLYNNGYRYQNYGYRDKVNSTIFCLNQNMEKMVWVAD